MPKTADQLFAAPVYFHAEPGGPGFWFKATGEPNLHERQVTMHLAELCREPNPAKPHQVRYSETLT